MVDKQAMGHADENYIERKFCATRAKEPEKCRDTGRLTVKAREQGGAHTGAAADAGLGY